jgi:hypothetical protein
MTTYLIFPASMVESYQRAIALKQRSDTVPCRVIGALSAGIRMADTLYDAVFHLPDYRASDCLAELVALIQSQAVTHLYCPNHVLAEWLMVNREAIPCEIELGAPLDDHNACYAAQYQRQAYFQQFLPNRYLNETQRTALFRLADGIVGYCSDDKINALIYAFGQLAAQGVRGDVVEIGIWHGKSCALLHWLSRYFDIGAVLAIDPWQLALQGSEYVDLAALKINIEAAFEGFKTAVTQVSSRQMNYLRLPSHDAQQQFCASSRVDSAEFGATVYQQQLAVLHIDGNHAYESALQDLNDWLPLVQHNGWLIMDDYEWLHDDGPKRAIQTIQTHYEFADVFVAGGAWFGRVLKASKS